MNDDNKLGTSKEEFDLLTFNDADELYADHNTFSNNILENFPYLKNDGLGQIQAHWSAGQDFENAVAPQNNAITGEGKIKQENEGVEKDSFSSNVNLNETKCSTSEENLAKTKSSRPNVQFLLKGKLGHNMDTIVKSFRQMLIEPIDVEEQLIVDYVYNYSKEIKTEPLDEPSVSISNSSSLVSSSSSVSSTSTVSSANSATSSNQCFQMPTQTFHEGTFQPNSLMEDVANQTNTVTESTAVTTNVVVQNDEEKFMNDEEKVMNDEEQVVRYTEPSIAEIRASFLGSSQCTQRFSDPNAESIVTNTEKDNEVEVKVENQDDSWCDSVLGKYTNTEIKSEELNVNTQSAKKGGRSDPENPFALTSPSFNDSTAKALMTTTQTSTATIIMISIMSIGSRAKLVPKIVNSKAAEGGLISIINPVMPPSEKTTQLNNEDQISSERTSFVSKLRRERSQPRDDISEKNANIDRLDINIKIEDDQYVGHGENKRWLCKICPKSYTTKHNLVAHILDHGDIKPHLCLVCEKYFKQLSHLNTHMLTHDNVKPYVCSICDKGFTQISHLKRHETVHMGSKPYICDLCNRGFAYPSELRLHKDKHKSVTEKCSDCDKKFNSWAELQEHMVECNHCGDLQCTVCDRIFRFPSQLKEHMKTHAGSRPFICTECGMDFMKEHHLRSHQFTHTGLRPFACPDCGRSFNQKANMHRHMLIHNAKRAYKCEVCSKTFTQPQTLKAHMVVHSDTKPYQCNICGKQFGRLHNLQGHKHMHSDSKPYTCSICQACFTLKGNLNRHKKVKHDLDESTEVMEEDAVNFLSTISDRTRNNYVLGEPEIDPDSQDGQSSLETRSNKKGWKSAKKKHGGGKLSVDEGDDDSDLENLISYSDEERENDRTNKITSKYFNDDLSENTSRSRRKTDTVLHADLDNDDDTERNKIPDKNPMISLENETDNTSVSNSPMRSMRKRKKKFYGDDFTETGIDMETSTRPQRKKTKS